MFRRSYAIEYDLSQKKMYLSDVLYTLELNPYAIRQNNRAYDMFKNQRVKTKHYTIRYNTNEYFIERIEWIRRHFLKQGYFTQENPTDEKSVQEVDHFHAVKILSYLK